MKRLHFQQSDFAETIRELATSGAPNPEIETRTADINAQIRISTGNQWATMV